jgi:hypothetical protein
VTFTIKENEKIQEMRDNKQTLIAIGETFERTKQLVCSSTYTIMNIFLQV